MAKPRRGVGLERRKVKGKKKKKRRWRNAMCECVFVYDLFKLEMQQNKKGVAVKGKGSLTEEA